MSREQEVVLQPEAAVASKTLCVLVPPEEDKQDAVWKEEYSRRLLHASFQSQDSGVRRRIHNRAIKMARQARDLRKGERIVKNKHGEMVATKSVATMKSNDSSSTVFEEREPSAEEMSTYLKSCVDRARSMMDRVDQEREISDITEEVLPSDFYPEASSPPAGNKTVQVNSPTGVAEFDYALESKPEYLVEDNMEASKTKSDVAKNSHGRIIRRTTRIIPAPSPTKSSAKSPTKSPTNTPTKVEDDFVIEKPPKPDWRQAVDHDTGRIYYYRKSTRETCWTKPDGYDELQAAYAKARQEYREYVTRKITSHKNAKRKPTKPEWRAAVDPTTGRVRYHNKSTLEISETKPNGYDEQYAAYAKALGAYRRQRPSWKKKTSSLRKWLKQQRASAPVPPPPVRIVSSRSVVEVSCGDDIDKTREDVVDPVETKDAVDHDETRDDAVTCMTDQEANGRRRWSLVPESPTEKAQVAATLPRDRSSSKGQEVVLSPQDDFFYNKKEESSNPLKPRLRKLKESLKKLAKQQPKGEGSPWSNSYNSLGDDDKMVVKQEDSSIQTAHGDEPVVASRQATVETTPQKEEEQLTASAHSLVGIHLLEDESGTFSIPFSSENHGVWPQDNFDSDEVVFQEESSKKNKGSKRLSFLSNVGRSEKSQTVVLTCSMSQEETEPTEEEDVDDQTQVINNTHRGGYVYKELGDEEEAPPPSPDDSEDGMTAELHDSVEHSLSDYGGQEVVLSEKKKKKGFLRHFNFKRGNKGNYKKRRNEGLLTDTMCFEN